MNRYLLTVPVLFVLLFFVSCVSLQVNSRRYTEDNFSFSKDDVFYLDQVRVTSYNFPENDEIGYILDRKLSFALSSSQGISINAEPENADFTIRPELIIKSYEVKYTEKNYFYDSKIQNLMIDKFIDDFKKSINK